MSDGIKILHLDSNHPFLLEGLEQFGFINHCDVTSSKEEIEKTIHQYKGIVIRSRFKIDQKFMEKATQLEFIARVGAGLENIDVAFARKKNIALLSAGEANSNAVGEHALGMLLSLFRKIPQANASVKQGNWLREEHRGIEIDGKTIGIIGYGKTGNAFAKKLSGFDCNVIFYDIKEDLSNGYAKQVSLEELQKQADVISLHVPYTEETHHYIATDFINQCKKPFWLLNTARGKCVNTKDLVEALQEKKILGAALDVLEFEKISFEAINKPAENPVLDYLIKAENVILTPHIAGWTVESNQKLAEVIVSKVKYLYNLEKEEKQKARVTGLGGIFFKATHSKKLQEWYAKHLGLQVDQYGCTFKWLDEKGCNATTQWSVFDEGTSYFSPSDKPFMQNFRVNNLKLLVLQLQEEGISIIGDIQEETYGKFAWIMDPEGNKIELWEPKDFVFL